MLHPILLNVHALENTSQQVLAPPLQKTLDLKGQTESRYRNWRFDPFPFENIQICPVVFVSIRKKCTSDGKQGG